MGKLNITFPVLISHPPKIKAMSEAEKHIAKTKHYVCKPLFYPTLTAEHSELGIALKSLKRQLSRRLRRWQDKPDRSLALLMWLQFNPSLETQVPSPPNLPWRLPKCTKMPHHLKIWPSRPPTCFKINPQRPKSATTSKSGPGDLQNASKSIPGGPSAHYFKIWPWRSPKYLKIDPWRPKWRITSKSGPGDLQNTSKSTP